MIQENPIHIRLDYYEAKESKKQMLSSEINILELKKSLAKYKQLRINELKKRETLAQKIKNLKVSLSKLKNNLPKITKSKFITREEKEIKPTKRFTPSSLEQELNMIKAKLQKLEE